MKTIEGLIQDSPEWHAHRATTRNASHAPAVQGVHPQLKRSELLHAMATGVEKEKSRFLKEVLFPRGHAVEPALREIAASVVGKELFPIVAVSDDGYLGASFDGVSMLEDVFVEAKQANESKMASVRSNVIPESDYWQVVQQFAVCETAERCIYIVGDGTREGSVWMIIPRSDIEGDIPALIAAWRQFDADLQDYEPEPEKVAPVAAVVEGFGALMLRVEGRVLASNLDAFKAGAEAFIARLPKPSELKTDQDFLDAKAAVKACSDAEARIKAEKAAVLAQMSDVDTVLRLADTLDQMIRNARLALDKSIKLEEANRKAELIQARVDSVAAHIAKINETLPSEFSLTDPGALRSDLGASIKGLSSLDSMMDKLDGTAAQAKIFASQDADRRRLCIALLPEDRSLFPDSRDLVANKAPDDLKNLIAARVAEHEKREAARLDDERAKIRAEEEAKARAAVPPQEPAPAVVSAPVSVVSAAPANDDGVRIKLGEINGLIAPVSINAEGLAQLGFRPVGTEKAAKLYRQSDLPAMLTAMSHHLLNAARSGALKKAA